MSKLNLPLEPDCTYHLFNRGNNKNLIFFLEKNYSYFLKRFSKYMSAYLDVFAYCLLPNHFHILVRVKSKEMIIPSFYTDFKVIPTRALESCLEQDQIGLPSFKNLASLESFSKLEEQQSASIISWAVSEKMRRFLMSYSKAINKQENRIGSLFQKPFRRKRVEDENYFTSLIWYIHNNPVHHHLCNNLTTYKWSSYQSHISDKPTQLNRKEVISWFGDVEAFISFHQQSSSSFGDSKYWME